MTYVACSQEGCYFLGVAFGYWEKKSKAKIGRTKEKRKEEKNNKGKMVGLAA